VQGCPGAEGTRGLASVLLDSLMNASPMASCCSASADSLRRLSRLPALSVPGGRRSRGAGNYTNVTVQRFEVVDGESDG